MLIEKRLKDIICQFDKCEITKVTPEASLTDDLGLDSLDLLELVITVEDEFDIEISEKEAEKIFTYQDALEFIENKMNF